MALEIGNSSGLKSATYYSGNTTATLRFAYTIQFSDVSDMDGISIAGGSLQWNGQNIAMDYPGLLKNSAYMVDMRNRMYLGKGTTPDLVAGSDSGISSTDNITNNTTPTIRINLTDSIGIKPGVFVYVWNESPYWYDPSLARRAITATEVSNGYIDFVLSNPLPSGTSVFRAEFSNRGVQVATEALNVEIDLDGPQVSSVAITGGTNMLDGKLSAGSVVSVTLNMNEATVVSGKPQVALDIGGTRVQATYASGSGTTALVFTYTILRGETDGDGISIEANSLSLPGGASLNDLAGNSATLTHAGAPNNPSYLVREAHVDLSQIAKSENGFAINGQAAGDWSGFSVSGAGDVTLKLSGSNYSLNLTAIANQGNSSGEGLSRINSIERIDITGNGSNVLKLSAKDVLDITGMNQFNTDSRWSGLGSSVARHQLVVDGNADDVLETSGWGVAVGTAGNNGNTYNVYNQGMAQLLVNTTILYQQIL